MEEEKTRFDGMTEEELRAKLARLNAQIQANEQELDSILAANNHFIDLAEHPQYLDLMHGLQGENQC